MQLIDKVIQVPKAVDDAANQLAAFVADVKHQLADGWDPKGDVPALLVDGVARLGAVMKELGDAAAEVKAYPKESLKAVSCSAIDLLLK